MEYKIYIVVLQAEGLKPIQLKARGATSLGAIVSATKEAVAALPKATGWKTIAVYESLMR